MSNWFPLLVLLTWFLAGCSSSIPKQTLLPAMVKAPTAVTKITTTPIILKATLSPLPKSPQINTSIPPLLAPSITPTTESLDLQIQQLCPQEATNVQEIGIDHYQLLVRKYFEKNENDRGYVPANESGVLVITNHDLIPQPVMLYEKPGWTLSGYGSESGGQSLQLWYKNDTNNQYALWRSSWDGQKQEKVYEYNPKEFSFDEVDDLLVTFQENPETRLSRPYSVQDRQTGETHLLPELPESSYNFPFVISGILYILYGDEKSGEQFMLYNDSTHQSQPAFPWFHGKDWVSNWTTPIFQKNDQLSIYVFRPYGFDFASDLSLDDILRSENYAEVMKEVHIPIIDDELMAMGSVIRQLDNGILFQAELSNVSEAKIFDIDLVKGIIKDYCLQLQSFLRIEVSPDNRFLAITNYYGFNPSLEHSPDYPSEIIILDIETGQRVRIQDPYYDVIGWGIAPNAP